MRNNKVIKFRAWSRKYKKMFYGKDVELWGNPVNGRVRTMQNDYDVDAELMLGTKVNDVQVFAGDIHKTEPVEVDGEIQSSYLPIVFDNGSFWIDESFEKDGSYLHLLSSYDEKLNIVGNIFDDKHLLTPETVNQQ